MALIRVARCRSLSAGEEASVEFDPSGSTRSLARSVSAFTWTIAAVLVIFAWFRASLICR